VFKPRLLPSTVLPALKRWKREIKDGSSAIAPFVPDDIFLRERRIHVRSTFD
jgi:hypothetical protein